MTKWTDETRPRGFDADVRLTGPVVTDVPVDTTRQVWITVRVPDDVPPGVYTGNLALEADGGATHTVPLTVEVPPFRLAEAGRILGAYVNWGYGFGRDPATYPDSRYEAKLQDLRDHGLNSLPILDGVSRREVDGEWVLERDDLRTLEEALDRARRRAEQGAAGGEAARERIRHADGFLAELRQRTQILPSEPVMLPPDADEYAALRETVIAHILALDAAP